MLNYAVLYRVIATLGVAVVLILLTLPPVFAVPTQEREALIALNSEVWLADFHGKLL